MSYGKNIGNGVEGILKGLLIIALLCGVFAIYYAVRSSSTKKQLERYQAEPEQLDTLNDH